MTLLSMLDRFEQAAVTYETSTDKADRDELHAARRAIMEREAELVKALELFAKAANPYDGVKSGGALWGDDGLTIGHLRAARAAIHPSLEQE